MRLKELLRGHRARSSATHPPAPSLEREGRDNRTAARPRLPRQSSRMFAVTAAISSQRCEPSAGFRALFDAAPLRSGTQAKVHNVHGPARARVRARGGGVCLLCLLRRIWRTRGRRESAAAASISLSHKRGAVGKWFVEGSSPSPVRADPKRPGRPRVCCLQNERSTESR